MKLYAILLVLMALGAVSSAVETSGIFQAHVPQAETTFDSSTVEEVSSGVSSTGVNAFTMISVIGLFFSVFVGAIAAVFTIIPLLAHWGVPFVWATMIQAPITLVELVGLYQFWTGYNLQGAE